MCPSDTYKVYKQGSNVRIDTTLLGFDHANWQRGNLSFVFKGQSKFRSVVVVSIRRRKTNYDDQRKKLKVSKARLSDFLILFFFNLISLKRFFFLFYLVCLSENPSCAESACGHLLRSQLCVQFGGSEFRWKLPRFVQKVLIKLIVTFFW